MEASAVAHLGVVTQCGSEFCKFAKVLSVKIEPVNVAGEDLEVAYGNFKVKHFLSMLLC